jgi:hypothetical protein
MEVETTAFILYKVIEARLQDWQKAQPRGGPNK